MTSARETVLARLNSIVEAYRRHGSVGRLLDELKSLADTATTADLFDAADTHADVPEVLGPLMEIVVDRDPTHARALVRLANAYWLTGRGPDVVGDLASRALAADPAHRGAWHLWALTETDPRARMSRWLQVTERFPDDDLARANLADSAASVGTTEDDPVAIRLALDTFTELRRRAPRPEQREAIDRAIEALRGR
jgi:hypothetical protein